MIEMAVLRSYLLAFFSIYSRMIASQKYPMISPSKFDPAGQCVHTLLWIIESCNDQSNEWTCLLFI